VFATNPHVTDPVREAVDSIESVLHEMLNDTPFAVPARVETLPESQSSRSLL